MSNKKYKLNLPILTLTASLLLHVILLVGFAVAKLSTPAELITPAETPQTRIRKIEKIISNPAVRPKPNVRKNTLPSPIIATPSLALKKLTLAEVSLDKTIIATKPQTFTLPSNSNVKVLEFFGSKSDSQNVCFVVDSSGSMSGIFSLVKTNLKSSIQSLEANQYFYIIFFGSGQLNEIGTGQMLRASPANRNNACEFIDSVTPAGTTNTSVAIKRAFEITDSLDQKADTVYFLTDGFDISDDTHSRFAYMLENYRKKLCPKTKINTIGFWTKRPDCNILKQLADSSGGEFTLIEKPKAERLLDFEFE